jgi:hypothetical protein
MISAVWSRKLYTHVSSSFSEAPEVATLDLDPELVAGLANDALVDSQPISQLPGCRTGNPALRGGVQNSFPD